MCLAWHRCCMDFGGQFFKTVWHQVRFRTIVHRHLRLTVAGAVVAGVGGRHLAQTRLVQKPTNRLSSISPFYQ